MIVVDTLHTTVLVDKLHVLFCLLRLFLSAVFHYSLDSIGGPNHLKNLCDASLLAVPQRAKGAKGIPPTLSFEHAGHPFGVNNGNGRTREELNAYGFLAKYVDAGVVVQPLYYYMGHISRHVRPGSRAVMAIVDHQQCYGTSERTFRPKGQVVVGGGLNDLARFGMEVTVWPCEGSTRQQWKWNAKRQIQVFGHDWLGVPTTSCLSSVPDEDLKGLTLTTCSGLDAGVFDLVPLASNTQSLVNIVLLNLNSTATGLSKSSNCVVIKELENRGGANGRRGGAQATLGRCSGPAAEWVWDEEVGEIASLYFSIADTAGKPGACKDVCLTTGWPFLQIGAYDTTPNGESEKTVVILNEARDSANYILRDGDDIVMSASIPPRSIQTVLLS
jgi:glucosylceramidase